MLKRNPLLHSVINGRTEADFSDFRINNGQFRSPLHALTKRSVNNSVFLLLLDLRLQVNLPLGVSNPCCLKKYILRELFS